MVFRKLLLKSFDLKRRLWLLYILRTRRTSCAVFEPVWDVYVCDTVCVNMCVRDMLRKESLFLVCLVISFLFRCKKSCHRGIYPFLWCKRNLGLSTMSIFLSVLCTYILKKNYLTWIEDI